MKKGKLLILLVALLSLAVIFLAACEDTTEPDDAETTSEIVSDVAGESGTESESATEETVETDVSDEQQYADHEMHSYFDLLDNEENDPIALSTRIDGSIVAMDKNHNLAVVVKSTVDALEIEETVVKVYDLASGEVIREDSVKSPYGNKPVEDVVTIEVTLHYPVIRVEKTTYAPEGEGENPKPHKEISYYVAEKDGELIHTTDSDAVEKYSYDNGLVCIRMGDKFVWIDRDMNVIRSVDTIVTNYNYMVYSGLFQSEYKGYLYSYDAESLMVFNHAGVVSAKYAVDNKDSKINCFVLDNGKVLVQELCNVGAYGSCDFVVRGTRYTVKSMIVDHVTGAVTDIKLDYVVQSLETEYEQEQEGTTPGLKLANGCDNLAVVYKIANGSIAASASLCVIDNDCNIVYTVKNDTFGVDVGSGIMYIGREKYLAVLATGGYTGYAIFDLDGNFITMYAANMSFTDDYIITDKAIYSYEMGLVYDFAAAGYEFEGVMNDSIFLKKINYVTGNVEWYRYTGRGTVALVSSDSEAQYKDMDYDYYILYNEDKEVYTVYNCLGEELLVSYEEVTVRRMDDVILFETTFSGEAIVYVAK